MPELGVRIGIPLDWAFLHFLESEFHGFAVSPVHHHLPDMGEDIRDLGGLVGPLIRQHEAFVTKEDLLRVWSARHLDVHRPIAGD